jgi:hypothetical protein
VQWRRGQWTHSPRKVQSAVIYFHEGDGEWRALQENERPSNPCWEWRCGSWGIVYEPEVRSAILEYKDRQWQPFKTSSERIDYSKLPPHIVRPEENLEQEQEQDHDDEEEENIEQEQDLDQENVENLDRIDGDQFSAWVQRQHLNILRASNEVGLTAVIENLDDEDVNENDEYQNSYINNNIIHCHYEGGYNDM